MYLTAQMFSVIKYLTLPEKKHKSLKRQKPAQKNWTLMVCCGSIPAGCEESPSNSELCL